MNGQTTLESLGYDTFFDVGRAEAELGGYNIARVTAGYKGSYKVRGTKGEYLGKLTGKQVFEAESKEDFPAVGDWVVVEELNDEQATIHGVLPRKTVIMRRSANAREVQVIASNVDLAFIVESIGRDYSLNRLERYIAIASEGGVDSAIILNKVDLGSMKELDTMVGEIEGRFEDTDLILTSITTSEGLEELSTKISRGKTYCFLGSSGVGKSSLINVLLGGNLLRTGDVGKHADRGKHVTTHREMYFLDNGGIVIDNPGMREVGVANVSAGIDSTFDEITALGEECKFVDCTHMHEPGCVVLATLKAGELDEELYMNYVSLKKESQHFEMTEIEKKEKDRKFGKILKNYKKNYRE